MNKVMEMSTNTCSVKDDAKTITGFDSGNDIPLKICGEVKQWSCDVCNVAIFLSYEEAVAHEIVCSQLNKQQLFSQRSSLNDFKEEIANVDTKEVSEELGAAVDSRTNNNNIEKPYLATDNEKVWICDVCKVASFATWEEAVKHELFCGNKTISPSTNESIHDNVESDIFKERLWCCDICNVATFSTLEEATTHEKLCKGGKSLDNEGISQTLSCPQESMPSRVIIDMLDMDDEDKEEDELLDPNPRRSKRGNDDKSGYGKFTKVSTSRAKRSVTKRDVSKQSESSKNLTIPSIFLKDSNDEKARRHLLEEQHIVEFQVKRCLMEQRERERQEKRAQIVEEKLKQKQKGQQPADEQPNVNAMHFFSRRNPPSKGNKRARVDNEINNSDTIVEKFDSMHVPSSTDRRLATVVPSEDRLRTDRLKQFPLFPNPIPCHLVPSDDDNINNIRDMYLRNPSEFWLTQEQLQNLNSRSNNQIVSRTIEQLEATCTNYCFENAKIPTVVSDIIAGPYLVNEKSQLLDMALQSQIEIFSTDMRQITTHCETAVPLVTWVDKYLTIKDIKTDICGNSLQETATELENFIVLWIAERQKSNAKMLERQKRLKEKYESSKKRKKQKTMKQPKLKYKDDDEFLWDDDDKSLGDGRDSLQNLFVLHGPVGCGKTAITHAVAQTLKCKVLEVNTTQERGQAGIKKVLLEATQSLSSVEMLKKQNERDNAAYFQSKFSSQGTLSDSDSETEIMDRKECDLGLLTVILIDEVDLLFNENGDSGFFQALNEVSKGAKCPIILTCNVYPKQLDSNSFRFRYRFVEYPEPKDCVSKMQTILRSEGYTVADPPRCLRLFDNIFGHDGCDMRHLVHQMESLVRAKRLQRDLNSSLQGQLHQKTREPNDLHFKRDIPRVISVQPTTIDITEYSLVTIGGSNFMQFGSNCTDVNNFWDVSVFIGDVLCPKACILDDSTIMAVCPPCVRSHEFENSDAYQSRRYRDVTYKPVVVVDGRQRGIVSSSRSTITYDEIADKTSFQLTSQQVNVDFSSPGFLKGQVSNSLKAGDPCSDDEFEFDARPSILVSAHAASHPITSTAQNHDIDPIIVSEMLSDGINRWKDDHMVSKFHNQLQPPCIHNENSFYEVANWFCNVSDAMLLQDVGTIGVSYLSGSCDGFGFDLTDEYPRRTNENSKPPCEEKLFTLGWNDNAFFYGDNENYMTLPCTSRERKLHHSATMRRAYPLSNGNRDNEDAVENEHNTGAVFIHDDEDTYLASDSISYLEELTHLLINPPLPELELLAYPLDLIGLRKKRTRRALESFQLLQNYIAPIEIYERISLFSKIEPEFDVLQEVKCEPVWFLDYLPILRNICISENHAECIFQATLQTAGEAYTATNRKFNTRRSSKRGRKHYLEEIVPKFVWDAFSTNAIQLGALIVSTSLARVQCAQH